MYSQTPRNDMCALMQFGHIESRAIPHNLTPVYPGAQAESEQPVCSSLQSRPRERPHPELRRPVSNKSASIPYRNNRACDSGEAHALAAPIAYPRTHLVEIEHQVQLAHIPKELIQHLDKEMDCLEIGKLIIIGIDADTEEQPRISPIHYLRASSELHKVGLVFLVSRRDETVHLRGH